MKMDSRPALRFSVPWGKYYDLMAGHVIELDDDSWRDPTKRHPPNVGPPKYYPGSTGGTAGAWSAGGTTRYFWVTRVSFADEGYMEVEAEEGVW